jgi:ABC-type dipeptide/oligopeptide/nickel transport system permease component
VLGTVITVFNNSLSYLIGGLVITERVFHWRGIGEALIDSITFSQFGGSNFAPAEVASLMTALALLFLLADLTTETAARLVDPRLRRVHRGAE